MSVKPKPNVIAFQPDPVTAWKYEDSWSTDLCDCKGECGELCYSFICCPCYACKFYSNKMKSFY